MPRRTVVPAVSLGAVDRPSQRVAEDEWAMAWRDIAEGCQSALTRLHPQHPRRDELVAIRDDARLAAGLPVVPLLRLA